MPAVAISCKVDGTIDFALLSEVVDCMASRASEPPEARRDAATPDKASCSTNLSCDELHVT